MNYEGYTLNYQAHDELMGLLQSIGSFSGELATMGHINRHNDVSSDINKTYNRIEDLVLEALKTLKEGSK
jgi:hypothetical protein